MSSNSLVKDSHLTQITRSTVKTLWNDKDDQWLKKKMAVWRTNKLVEEARKQTLVQNISVSSTEKIITVKNDAKKRLQKKAKEKEKT